VSPPLDLKAEREILQWDVATWSAALEFWERGTDWGAVSDCLEIGAGPGGISLWLARKGKNVTCSDIEELHIAKALHAKHGFSGTITYQTIDASDIRAHETYDLIVMKSVLGGIGSPPTQQIQQKVVDGIYDALRPGGTLLFAENLTASRLHRFFRENFIRWGKQWRYLTVDECKGFCRRFSSFEIHTTGVAATFGRTEQQRHFLARLDSLVLNRACPPSWRYLAYGIARR
jgi:SAM-dependent methyltransferase